MPIIEAIKTNSSTFCSTCSTHLVGETTIEQKYAEALSTIRVKDKEILELKKKLPQEYTISYFS
jgi:hypothetical protein